MTGSSSFKVGIEFESVLRAISKQIYETPMAFIRENVQNAVDAIRIQALRENVAPADERYRIEVTLEDRKLTVRDNGIGMSAADLQNFFWTIGASGKRTSEALKAGCVGMFGIGGFANFGVCDMLEVISQTEGAPQGTYTGLSQEDINAAGAAIPSVTVRPSDDAAPRGTIVIGHLRDAPNGEELRRYLRDFVRFVPIAITFNGERVSQERFWDVDDRENLTPISSNEETWRDGDLSVTGRLYEDKGRTIIAGITGLTLGEESIGLTGQLRFENGAIDAFKRGFKLCATQIGTIIGVSGRLDCDRFVPTAGRDSLDAATTSLLGPHREPPGTHSRRYRFAVAGADRPERTNFPLCGQARDDREARSCPRALGRCHGNLSWRYQAPRWARGCRRVFRDGAEAGAEPDHAGTRPHCGTAVIGSIPAQL
jgi:molecular chaperone HtpG